MAEIFASFKGNLHLLSNLEMGFAGYPFHDPYRYFPWLPQFTQKTPVTVATAENTHVHM